MVPSMIFSQYLRVVIYQVPSSILIRHLVLKKLAKLCGNYSEDNDKIFPLLLCFYTCSYLVCKLR